MQRIKDAGEFAELLPIMHALLIGMGRPGDAADLRAVAQAGGIARALTIEQATVDIVAIARLLRELSEEGI
jgi:hypothetical protein